MSAAGVVRSRQLIHDSAVTGVRVAGVHGVVLRLMLAVFFATLALDTGRTQIGGLNAAMVSGGALTAAALLRWQLIGDRVVRATVAAITMWVIWQWVLGASLMGGVRMLSVIAMALALAGAPLDRGFARFQLKLAVLPSLILVAIYYSGFGRRFVEERITISAFGLNTLALLFATGVILIVCIFWVSRGRLRWPILAVSALYMPPLWATGSRKAILLLLVSVIVGLVLRRRKNPATWVALAALISLISLNASAVVSVLPPAVTESAVFRARYVDYLESDYLARVALLERGIDAVKTRPWIGHGVDAPHSDAWLTSEIGRFSAGGQAIGTHNGLVDYAIMGGWPLLAVFLLLYGVVWARLWRVATSKVDRETWDLAVSAVMLLIVFYGYIFAGDLYTKPGWWIFGFCLYVIRLGGAAVRESRHGRARTAAVQPVDPVRFRRHNAVGIH